MLDTIRTRLHGAITSKAGDSLMPVRLSKDLARRANTLFGLPLCSEEELAKRKAAAERLQTLRAKGAVFTPSKQATAPVTVYFEKDRNARELARIEELLTTKGITFASRDVAGDDATKAFVCRTAGCKDDELPIVFVGSDAVGNYQAVVAADVSGELAKKIGG
ncbi:MAG: hypothetical protein ABI551_21335 [Polyangiaceae bacterium]